MVDSSLPSCGRQPTGLQLPLCWVACTHLRTSALHNKALCLMSPMQDFPGAMLTGRLLPLIRLSRTVDSPAVRSACARVRLLGPALIARSWVATSRPHAPVSLSLLLRGHCLRLCLKNRHTNPAFIQNEILATLYSFTGFIPLLPITATHLCLVSFSYSLIRFLSP